MTPKVNPINRDSDNEEEEKNQHDPKICRVIFETDFTSQAKKLCEDVCFHMEAFAKLHHDNPRPKGILVRLYGWDEFLTDIFFPNRRDEHLKHPLPAPNDIFHKLGLHLRTFKARNNYNKLKLFYSELIANNRKYQ